ncbi:DNA-dependent RNA polymerase [Leptospirillum ferrooxidans]|jgi:hypothetical protein|uniref:Putative DNA-dependent RNA polymerase n=1 Tax=Leptospirillum ferrooxidans (strain C2-3) TaxID=1162668 RepID=I0INC7_LEPFC|nr:DNA-dependent RNA polymerase [Leptospirillum ferrooxidans]BAM06776.1 putative DNA-dependent RNA polymerase [Leptospirillum ferrooxidans C2-3]
MNRMFLSGFLVSLIVITIPLVWLIDARSSSRVLPTPPVAVPEARTTFSLPVEPPAPVHATPVTEADPSDNIVMVKKLPEKVIPPEESSGEVRDRAPIRTLVYDASRLYTLRTALSHVTIVDLPEDAREVYVGDSKLFLAEVLGSRIKVKPITYDLKSRTNMIVYTEHDRLSFRLLVVPPGEEDDLLSFRLPKSETVVNLNPIKTVLRKKLKEEESQDLSMKRRDFLKEGDPQHPLRATFHADKLLVRLLGFSSLDQNQYAVIDCRNDSGHDVTLRRIRLRRFQKSLLWETSRHYEDGMDWSRDLDKTVPAGQHVRLLLEVGKITPLSQREGLFLSGRVRTSGGGEIAIKAVSAGERL